MAGRDETQFQSTARQDESEKPTVSAPAAIAASATGLASLPMPGEVIDERFRVVRVLGHGGMGAVFEVVHLKLNERYALKVLLPDRAHDPDTVARFMREARASARIKSEHVVAVSDVGQLPNGAPYILMEYLVGKDLAEYLHESGPLDPKEAAGFVLQACAGVAEAHALGFVHRDLKPSNLFLTQRSDGEPLVKVLDFGIAKATAEDGVDNPKLTETRAVFGSPAYMSPEQVRSARKVDVRTDIWSLGVILYELLTGHLPFDGETSAGLLAAISADAPTPLHERRPGIHEELATVVMACLEKKVDHRIQTVGDLATALAPFAEGASVSVGRIQRLSIPVGARSGPAMAPRVASAKSAPRVGTVTDEPWTTSPSRRASGGRLIIAACIVVTVMAVGVALKQRFTSDPTPVQTVAAPPSQAPLPPSVSFAPPPASPPSAASPSSSSPSAAPSPAPGTPSKPARAAAKPVSAAKPGLAPTPELPPPPAPPAAPRDPLGDSH